MPTPGVYCAGTGVRNPYTDTTRPLARWLTFLAVVCNVSSLVWPCVQELTEGEMVQVLTEPRSALVKQYASLLAMSGARLVVTRTALRAIARQVLKCYPVGNCGPQDFMPRHLPVL
jgi:hypothetical protein